MTAESVHALTNADLEKVAAMLRDWTRIVDAEQLVRKHKRKS